MSVLFKALSRSAEDNRSAKGTKPSLVLASTATRTSGGRRGREGGKRARTWRYALLAVLLVFAVTAVALAFLPHLWTPSDGADRPLVIAAAEPLEPAEPIEPAEAAVSEADRLPVPASAEHPAEASSSEAAETPLPAVMVSEAPTPAEMEAEAEELVAAELVQETSVAEPPDPFEPPPLNLRPPPGAESGTLRDLVPLQQLAQRVLDQAAGAPSGRAERMPPAWSGSGGTWETDARPGTPRPTGGGGVASLGAQRQAGLVIDAGPSPDLHERELRGAQQAMAQGAFAAAVPLYERALLSSPADAEVEMGLAVALQRLGREDEAIAVYNRLLAREPNNLPALTNFFGLVGSRSPALAIEEMRRLLLRNPEQPAILAQLGLVYAQAGDRVNALTHIEEAVRLAPGNPVYAMNLAVLNDQLGRRDEAIRNYRLVLQLAEAQGSGQLPVASVRERLRYLNGN